MITAPQDAIVTNGDIRLDYVVFKSKGVFANFGVAPDKCAGADVGGELIPLAFQVFIKSAT